MVLNWKCVYIGLILFLCVRSISSAGPLSGGLSLLEPPGARASALGEAFSAAQNDIHALHYNPASLPSLEQSQLSFYFRKGLMSDSFGRVMFGRPSLTGGFGISASYYNGGEIELMDGSSSQMLTGQRDIILAAGYGRQVGSFSLGVSGKYMSSMLIESVEARAAMMDAGAQFTFAKNRSFGLAVQNVGGELKYQEDGNALPRIVRAGFSSPIFSQSYPTTLWTDAAYYMNEQSFRPAIGLEIHIGPMQLRGGYQGGMDLNGYSVGFGFGLGQISLDYSLALFQRIEVQHRISLTRKFPMSKASTPQRETREEKDSPDTRQKGWDFMNRDLPPKK